MPLNDAQPGGFFIMEYKKPPLSFEEQIELLQSRGLIIQDTMGAVSFLKRINYYRLSAYCIPFQHPKDIFKKSTTLEDISDLYFFDRKLRQLVFDALQTIEIAMRTRISYQLAHTYGTFGYVKPDNFAPRFTYHARWKKDLQSAIRRSREEFVQHYSNKYSCSPHLPIWMVVELISFGMLSRLVRGLKHQDLKGVCKLLNVPTAVFPSWMHSLSYVRNICAHHGRLWNRQLAIPPKIPKPPIWRDPFKIPNDRFFSIAVIIHYLFKWADTSDFSFKSALKTLLKTRSTDHLGQMGFPPNWVEHTIWHV